MKFPRKLTDFLGSFPDLGLLGSGTGFSQTCFGGIFIAHSTLRRNSAHNLKIPRVFQFFFLVVIEVWPILGLITICHFANCIKVYLLCVSSLFLGKRFKMSICTFYEKDQGSFNLHNLYILSKRDRALQSVQSVQFDKMMQSISICANCTFC